jgi:chromate reductase
MSTTKIAIIVGSLRKDSHNLKLAKAVQKLAPQDFEFTHVRIDDLPLYTQEFDDDYPAVAQRLKREIEGADGLIFVTPEYNRSIPGVLKNAIDIGSRPWGRNSFAGKPAGVIGASIGTLGTALAQQHLRNVLAYLDAPTLGQPEVYLRCKDGMFDIEGTITDDDTRKFLQKWVNAYVAWVARHR